MCNISEDEIREKAEKIYRARGGKDGSAEDDWKQAKEILEKEPSLLRSLRRVKRKFLQSVARLLSSNSEVNSKPNNYRLELWIALLALLGSMAGSFIGSYLESSRWETRVQYEAKTQILNQRIKLIERSATLLTKSSRAVLLNTLVKSNLKISEEIVQLCSKWEKEGKGETDFCKKTDRLLEHIPEYNLELINLDSDFSATMQLNALYFCSNTKEKIKKITDNSSPWYETSKDTKLELLGAMVTELKCPPL